MTLTFYAANIKDDENVIYLIDYYLARIQNTSYSVVVPNFDGERSAYGVTIDLPVFEGMTLAASLARFNTYDYIRFDNGSRVFYAFITGKDVFTNPASRTGLSAHVSYAIDFWHTTYRTGNAEATGVLTRSHEINYQFDRADLQTPPRYGGRITGDFSSRGAAYKAVALYQYKPDILEQLTGHALPHRLLVVSDADITADENGVFNWNLLQQIGNANRLYRTTNNDTIGALSLLGLWLVDKQPFFRNSDILESTSYKVYHLSADISEELVAVKLLKQGVFNYSLQSQGGVFADSERRYGNLARYIVSRNSNTLVTWTIDTSGGSFAYSLQAEGEKIDMTDTMRVPATITDSATPDILSAARIGISAAVSAGLFASGQVVAGASAAVSTAGQVANELRAGSHSLIGNVFSVIYAGKNSNDDFEPLRCAGVYTVAYLNGGERMAEFKAFGLTGGKACYYPSLILSESETAPRYYYGELRLEAPADTRYWTQCQEKLNRGIRVWFFDLYKNWNV